MLLVAEPINVLTNKASSVAEISEHFFLWYTISVFFNYIRAELQVILIIDPFLQRFEIWNLIIIILYAK